MRTYKKRDCATEFLRKCGIEPKYYDIFIRKVDNYFQVDDELLNKYQTNSKLRRELRRKHRQYLLKIVTPTGGPVFRKICELIRQGKTNKEIWGIIQPMFNLSDKKRNYPGWYRCYLRRRGMINSPRIYNCKVEVNHE